MRWLWLFLLPLHTANAGVPLVVKVEPGVSSVSVSCPDGNVQTQEVKNNQVSFDIVPKNCTVSITKKVGKVNNTGVWFCSERGCELNVPPHKKVENADGRVNLIFLDSAKASTIELSCSGYRERTPIEDFTAVFDDVPLDDCTVYAKGGTTAKSQPLGWGTHVCTISGPTLICQSYKP